MMGLGPMGSGAGGYSSSSSSTSNLSALAPPFTVDRLNPKPNSNPNSRYSDLQFTLEPVGQAFAVDRLNPKPNSNPTHYSDLQFTLGRTWEYASPSAPKSEFVMDSTGTTTAPSSGDYRFSASATFSPSTTHWSALSPSTMASSSAFAYGGEVKPYYSHYVPPLAGEDSLFVEDERSRYNVVPTSGLSETSRIDYTQSLFDVECGSKWGDSLGFVDGKRAKRVELDGSFLSAKANVGFSRSFKNQLSQGGRDIENWKKPKEDSGASYKKYNQVPDKEVHTGFLSAGHIEDKSCLEQNIGFFPYDSNKAHIQASSSTYPEPYPSVLSCEMHKNFSDYQISCSPFEKCVSPVDTPLTIPVSVIRSSPTVVIRPPPATNGTLGKKSIVSCKGTHTDNVGGVQTVDFDHSNPSKLKDSGLKQSSKTEEDSFETNCFNFSQQGIGINSSPSVKEMSSPLQYRDTFDRKMKSRFGSQLPDINVLGGFAMACDNVQVANSAEDISDFTDHHNPAVDSPCWRGAPSSQFSQIDVEAGNSNHVKKKMDEYYGFGHEEHQNVHSIVDSSRVVFSEKVGEGNRNNENECGRNVGLTLERTLDALYSSKEQSLLNDAKGRMWVPTMTSNEGVDISDDPNMPRKESGLLNNLTSGFKMKVSTHLIGEEGAGMSLNDVSEGGAVAVDAAEKVLASPASQEDAAEHIILPDPKLNVPTMIKTIYNLSELLLFHLSNDACSLEEENAEAVKHVISNLDSCLSKKTIQATNKPKPGNHVGDTSEKLGESRDVGTISGSPNTTNETASSYIKLDYHHMHEEDGNCSFSGKKDQKPPIFSPFRRDDVDITKDDDMAKAIKKVLEENLHFDEEMHSQALLFKNLWLDAEAKLCSISYKARFDRMKIQMKEMKRKAQQENEDIAEMMSKISILPHPITASDLDPKTHDGTISKPSLQDISIPGTSKHADNIEASVMARFNILKSREDNPKPVNMEEQQPEMIDGEHASSIMARLNILKSREENSKSISSVEEEHQSKTVYGEFAGEKYVGPYIRGQSEDETLNVFVKPHFLHQTGSVSEDKSGSYMDGYGYEGLDEFHLSVTNDPIISSFKNSRMVNQYDSGWPDSSSSDWEHVLKDDFSLKIS